MGWNVEILARTSEVNSGWRKFLDYQRHIRKEVERKQADVVLACDLYSLYAARWMKENGKANVLIYDAREVYTELPSVASSPLKKAIWKLQERRGMMKTDRIIVSAPDDAQAICDVHRFLPRPVLVRNLPWRNAELKPDPSILRQFHIPEYAKTIVYIGGITHGRALKNTIEAMRKLSAHFLIIGDGVLLPELKNFAEELQIGDRVHFAGTLESNDALQIAASCDAGISLVEPISKSYALGLPSKIFEYMMCGIPVVANRLKQVTDLFPNEEWMTCVDETDANSIAEGIQHALKNSENGGLRDRERALALEHYHFECDAENLTKALQTFLK